MPISEIVFNITPVLTLHPSLIQENENNGKDLVYKILST